LSSTNHAIVEVDGKPIGVLAMQSIDNPRIFTVIIIVCFRAEDKVTFKKKSTSTFGLAVELIDEQQNRSFDDSFFQ